MRALLALLAACTDPAPAQPDANLCGPPPEGWYRQSDSCVDVVTMSAARWDELVRLRDDFVVYAACASDVCGPPPEIPPAPGVAPAGSYVEGDCVAWREWDRAMVAVASWAECTK